MNDVALGSKHGQSILQEVFAAGKLLQLLSRCLLVGPDLGRQLQCACMQHVFVRNLRCNGRQQKVIQVPEGQVQGQPLSEVLVVEDAVHLGTDAFFAAALATVGEFLQRLLTFCHSF